MAYGLPGYSVPGQPDDSSRKRILRRWEALKRERQTWLDEWRDISDHILPRRSRFLCVEVNRSRRNDKIINSTPSIASRTLAAGMMAGLTSPARPWFRLTTPDPSLAEYGPVRQWLHVIEERMRQAFARSNLYNALHQTYTDLPVFGSAPMHIDEDDEELFRAYVYPAGQYALASSANGRVQTVYRSVSLTVEQMFERFGRESCSRRVRDLHDRGNIDEWVEVLHVVQPNRDRKLGRAGPEGMPYKACWLELVGGEELGYLREGGYQELPTLCPRWSVTGEDVYGAGPGRDALGDCRALQHLERRYAQLVDKTAMPPMVGPAHLLSKRGVSLLPGDFTAIDAMSIGQRVEPAMVVPPQALPAVMERIREHESRINSAFFADLWLMMVQTDRRQITAREVAERHEEKMFQLGPVVSRLEDELLDPLFDRCFGLAVRGGWVPMPPEELQGTDLRIEYVSIIHQAQKLLGVTAVERQAQFVIGLASAKPEVLDKLNADEAVDTMGDMLGVPPNLMLSDDKVAEIRQARAQQAQQMQVMQAMQQQAQTVKTLADAPTGGDTALNRMLGAYGVAPPAGGVA